MFGRSGDHPISQKVTHLTSTQNWGSARSEMAELINMVSSADHFRLLTDSLQSRMMDQSDWHIPFKSVELMEYIILNAHEDICSAMIDRMKPVMVQLARIEQREGTRNKIYAVLDLINDPNKLQQERQKAHALKSKFQGYSNESPPPPASRDYAPRSPVQYFLC
jgi:hypothetical protein